MTVEPQLLKGKNAAITGGLTGIGKAIALGFLRHGCNVAINYLGQPGDDSLLNAMKSEVPNNGTSFLAVAGDISIPERGAALVAAVVKEWGRLDVFVSNAGICKFAEFLEYGRLRIATSTWKTPTDQLFMYCAASNLTSSAPRSTPIYPELSTLPRQLRGRWLRKARPEGPSSACLPYLP